MMQKLLLFAGLIGLVQSCHVGRSITKFKANITDHKVFPYTPITPVDQPFQFHEKKRPSPFVLRLTSGKEQPLKEYLDEKTTTVAFLVIHKDSILFEHYFEDYQQDDISNIFSASKSVTSLLTGIAIDEGKIKGIDDPVTVYIPELKMADPKFQRLTIAHLLDMRSGIEFKETYGNPFAKITRLYYGRNQLGLLKKLKFEHEPGTVHKYQSITTSILGMVVERAVGMELGQYLEQKVWQPLGMEFNASWSIDDQKHRSAKAFCCLNTTARDLAKIGRLYLQDGQWDGQQIVSSEWIQRSKTPNMDNDCYQFQWYSDSGIGYEGRQEMVFSDSLSAVKGAMEKGFKHFYVDEKTNESEEIQEKQWHIHYCSEDFYALGILGQYLYVNPKNDLIMVRLGEKWDSNYSRIFKQVIRQVEGPAKAE